MIVLNEITSTRFLIVMSWIRSFSRLWDTSWFSSYHIGTFTFWLWGLIIDEIVFLSNPCSFRLLSCLNLFSSLWRCILNDYTSTIEYIIWLCSLMVRIWLFFRLFWRTHLNARRLCCRLLIKRLACQLLILIYNGIFHIWIILLFSNYDLVWW